VEEVPVIVDPKLNPVAPADEVFALASFPLRGESTARGELWLPARLELEPAAGPDAVSEAWLSVLEIGLIPASAGSENREPLAVSADGTRGKEPS
jgi:hypothetical protein